MKDRITYLVSEAQNGNQTAFTELYELSEKEVWFTCISLLKNESHAKDAMQNTYIAAFTKLNTLEDPTRFCAWIKKIAVNKCKDFLKSRMESGFDETDLENISDTDELVVPEEYIINNEKRQCIMRLLEENLSPVQYQTLILYYFDELTVSEIAAVMNCPEGTVMSRLNLARSKMKKAIIAYENKNNDKLHAFAPIVLFAGLFSAQSHNLSVPQISLHIPQNTLTAAAVSSAVKTGGKIAMSIKTKVIIGICAAAVVVGGVTTTAIIISSNNTPETRPTAEMSVSGTPAGDKSTASDDAVSVQPEEGLIYSENLENNLQDMAYAYLSSLIAKKYDESLALLKLPESAIVTTDNIAYCMTHSDYKDIADLDIDKTKIEIREAGYSNSEYDCAYVVFKVTDTTGEERNSSKLYTIALKEGSNGGWYIDDDTFYNTNFSFHAPSGDIELTINGIRIDDSYRVKENTSYYALLDMYTIPYIDKKDVELTVRTENYEYTYTIATESDNNGERYMLYDELTDEEENILCEQVKTIFNDLSYKCSSGEDVSTAKEWLADDCVDNLDTDIWDSIKKMIKPSGFSGSNVNICITECLKSDKTGGGSFWLSDNIVCARFKYEMKYEYVFGSMVKEPKTMHRYGALLLEKDGENYKIYSLEADTGLFSTANEFCNEW